MNSDWRKRNNKQLKILTSAFALAILIAAGVMSLNNATTVEATAHDIESGECAAPPADGTPADTQSPPVYQLQAPATF